MNQQKRPNPFVLDLEGQTHTGTIRLEWGPKIVEAYVEVDGYWVIDATTFSPGALDEYSLQCLAELLKDTNASWNAEIESFFAAEKKKEGNA